MCFQFGYQRECPALRRVADLPVFCLGVVLQIGYSLEEVADRFHNKERPYGPKQLRRDAAAKEISVEDLFKFLKDQSRRGKCRGIP